MREYELITPHGDRKLVRRVELQKALDHLITPHGDRKRQPWQPSAICGENSLPLMGIENSSYASTVSAP